MEVKWKFGGNNMKGSQKKSGNSMAYYGNGMDNVWNYGTRKWYGNSMEVFHDRPPYNVTYVGTLWSQAIVKPVMTMIR